MAEIEDHIIDIATRLAAIDERTKALQAADVQAQSSADHRHKNVMQAIENFVPRREIEAENAAIRKYAAELAERTQAHCDMNRELVVGRVAKIEDSITDFTKTFKSARNKSLYLVGAGLASLLGWGLHLIVKHYFGLD